MQLLILDNIVGGVLLNPVTSGVRKGIELILELTTFAILAIIDYLVIGITERLLLFPNPADAENFEGLEVLYNDMMVFVFFPSLALIVLSFLFAFVFFPHVSQTDPYRFTERVLAAVFLVLIGPAMFEHIFDLHNALGGFILPENYTLAINESTEGLASGVGFSIAFVVLIYVLGTGIITSLVTFWLVLAMRMLLLATVYGLFPLLMALWIPDVSIGKHTSMFAEMIFKIFAVMLLLGPMVAGILAVGDVISDGPAIESEGSATGESMSSQESVNSTEHNFDFGDESAANSTGEFSSNGLGNSDWLLEMLFPVFAYLGSIWASITAVMLVMGMFAGGIGGGSGGGSGAASESEDDSSEKTALSTQIKEAGGQMREKTGEKLESVGDSIDGNENTDYEVSPEGDVTEASNSSLGAVGGAMAGVGRKMQDTSISEGAKSKLASKHRDWKYGSANNNVTSYNQEDRKLRNKAYSKLAGGANRLKNGGVIFGKAMMEDDPKKSLGIIADGVRKSDILDPDEDPEDMDDVPEASGPAEYGYGNDPENNRTFPSQDESYEGEQEYFSEDEETTRRWEDLDVGRDRTPYKKKGGINGMGKGDGGGGASDSGLDEDFNAEQLDDHAVEDIPDNLDDLEDERFNTEGTWEWQPDGREEDQLEGRQLAFDNTPFDSDDFGNEEIPVNYGGKSQILQVGHVEQNGEKVRAVNFYDPNSSDPQRLEPGNEYEAQGVGVREYPKDRVMYEGGMRQRTIHTDADSASYNQIQIDASSNVSPTDK